MTQIKLRPAAPTDEGESFTQTIDGEIKERDIAH
jgi:hypothetical protein